MLVQFWQRPDCERVVEPNSPPNWTAMPAPTANGWTVILSSCPGCSRALGTYTYPGS